MAFADDDQTTLRLRVVYEANQAIGTAIADIRKLKEETGGLSVENQKTLQILEHQKTMLDGIDSSLDKHVAKVHQDALAQRAIRQALEETSEAQEVVATKTINTATAHGKMGRGVLQASYAVQDFTSVLTGGGGFVRALGSVQNNIPVLLSGLGVGAGLAGTISLVSVGLGAAIPLLSNFVDMQDKAAEATKKHAEEADKLKSALTTEQEQIKSAVEKYTKDANNKVIGQALQSALFSESRNEDVTDKDLSAALSGLPIVPGETIPEQLKRGRIAARKTRAEQDANRLLATLSTDPSSRAEASRLADAHGGFPMGFSGAMRSPLTGTPDALFNAGVDQYDEVMKQVEESDKRKKEARKEADERVAADNLAKKFAREHDADEAKTAEREAAERVAADNLAKKFAREHDADEAKTAEADAKKAERAAAKAAHDADPRIANRRAMQAEQSQALNLVAQNTHGFNAPQQHEIARHLQQSYDEGLGMSHSFQEILANAIRQTHENYARGIQAGLRRQQQNSQSFYAP